VPKLQVQGGKNKWVIWHKGEEGKCIKAFLVEKPEGKTNAKMGG